MTDIANLLDTTEISDATELERLSLCVDIVRLRSEGKSYAQVAEILHTSPKTVRKAIKFAMRTILRENGAEEVRAIEMSRMEKAAQRLLPYLDKDSTEETVIITKSGLPVEVKVSDLPPNPQLIDAYLKVSKAKRDMVGADAAQKVTINLDEGEQVVELNDRLSRLERLQNLTDHIARAGIGSGRVDDDEIVDAEIIDDGS